MITIGTTIRLPQTPEPMIVAKVITHDEDGRVTATIDQRPASDYAPEPSPWVPPPHAGPADRPSPPTDRCHCRPMEDGSGRPRSHRRACPDHTVEDEAWVATHWYDASIGKAPSYAEALARLRREASAASASAKAAEAPRTVSIPAGTLKSGGIMRIRGSVTVPSDWVTITLPAKYVPDPLPRPAEEYCDRPWR